jgi:hypothetical protein
MATSTVPSTSAPSPFPSRISSYEFIKRLGLKTSPHPLQRFYGCNSAVYLARLLASGSLSIPSTTLPATTWSSEFVIKIIYNYDDSLRTHDLMSHIDIEMKLC